MNNFTYQGPIIKLIGKAVLTGVVCGLACGLGIKIIKVLRLWE